MMSNDGTVLNSMTVLAQNESLPFLNSQERLDAYNLIIAGCSHVWSKGELQVEGAQKMLDALIPLTQKDPNFLAHLLSYAMTKTDNKDLQSFATLANSLSKADGKPFSPGSKYLKPNLRYISAAALHKMDIQMALRVLQLINRKYGVQDLLPEANHFPQAMVTAFKNYLKYREANLDIVRGAKEAGLGNKLVKIYKGVRMNPSDEVAAILKWAQKGKDIKFEDSKFKEFATMTDLEIAEKIRKEKLSPLGIVSALPRQMSPVVAVALLEQCTGNLAVILRRLFDEAGVLSDPEVLKLYESKVKTAKTALDRAKTLSDGASAAVKEVLANARSEQRKTATAGVGKIYLHLDLSASMDAVLRFAVERGAIIAECVNNPRENFRWGRFSTRGQELELPDEFVADAFAAKLFNEVTGGSTDCFALYENARNFGAEVDVFVTDQGHNVGNMEAKIRQYHEQHPEVAKPKVVVIVNYGTYRDRIVQNAFESNGIPVSVLAPETLTESALVTQAVRTAMLGPVQIVDEIMDTPLLELPEYYFTL